MQIEYEIFKIVQKKICGVCESTGLGVIWTNSPRQEHRE